VDWIEEVACEEYPVYIYGSGAASRRATRVGKPETDKQNWAETRCCLSSRSIGTEEKGGSLACLLHHLSPEFSIAQKSRRLISGSCQRGRSRVSYPVRSANWKWNLGATSGFFTLRKE
jgi:hypothetical protein